MGIIRNGEYCGPTQRIYAPMKAGWHLWES